MFCPSTKLQRQKRGEERDRDSDRQSQRDKDRYRETEIQRDGDTERHRNIGGGEQTRMNDNETNTLAPLWPCLCKDNCYENVPQSNIIFTNVRSVAQYGLSVAYLNNSNV